MSNYQPKEFINAIEKKLNGNAPSCRFCGHNKFTTTDNIATIMISKELGSVSLGPNVPAGMLVCENCGHIDFFALGALGFMNEKDVHKNGGKTED